MTAQLNLSMLALVVTLAVPGLASAETRYSNVDVLLQSKTTVIGEDIMYPDGPAQITAAIVSIGEGQATGWHHHEAPLTAHILEGELTVDYGENGKRVYQEGDTLIEALGSRHNGKNTGNGVAKVLVVFSGAVGTSNTVSE